MSAMVRYETEWWRKGRRVQRRGGCTRMRRWRGGRGYISKRLDGVQGREGAGATIRTQALCAVGGVWATSARGERACPARPRARREGTMALCPRLCQAPADSDHNRRGPSVRSTRARCSAGSSRTAAHERTKLAGAGARRPAVGVLRGRGWPHAAPLRAPSQRPAVCPSAPARWPGRQRACGCALPASPCCGRVASRGCSSRRRPAELHSAGPRPPTARLAACT